MSGRGIRRFNRLRLFNFAAVRFGPEVSFSGRVSGSQPLAFRTEFTFSAKAFKSTGSLLGIPVWTFPSVISWQHEDLSGWPN